MRSLLLCFFLATAAASAQQSLERLGVRVNAGFGSSSHSGALHGTRGIIDCGEITTGSGTGLIGSVGMELALGSWFGVGLELGIAQRGGTFTRENIYPLRDSATGTEVNMLAAHTLSTTLSTIDVAPQLIIPIIGVFKNRILGLQIGPRFALVQTASYRQEETVMSPDNAYFIENGAALQSRVVDANDFAAATSMLTGITASLESVIGLSDRVALAPRISYDYFFTSALSDVRWDVRGVRGEIGIRWSIPPAAPVFIPPPPPPPPVIVKEEPPSFAPPRIAITAGPFTGEIVTGNALRASVPIVNAVFFDSASAEIPPNYRRTRDGSVMSTDAIEAHDWTMVRIANIVAENPNARIVLEGTTSGLGNEQDASLPKQRAERVRQVLLNLGVASSAITVKPLTLPRIASNNDLAGGREENRRVDIVVVNAPLQRWVQTEEFAEARGTLAVTSQLLGGDPSRRPDQVTYTISDQDTTASMLSPSISKSMIIPVQPSLAMLTIPTRASAGGASAAQQVDVDLAKLSRRRIALRTDGFEAVLRFDYNSSELQEDVKILLQQLAEQLPEGSTITIDGSADVLGTQERNRVLSESRAATTQAYLRSITKKSFTFTSSSQNKSFSNATPQGRFLNRNIRIRVTTP
jgi:outer membrane protein OmpA-like peptidoglycan-associated protein